MESPPSGRYRETVNMAPHKQHSFLSIVVQFSSGCMYLKAVPTTPLSPSML